MEGDDQHLRIEQALLRGADLKARGGELTPHGTTSSSQNKPSPLHSPTVQLTETLHPADRNFFLMSFGRARRRSWMAWSVVVRSNWHPFHSSRPMPIFAREGLCWPSKTKILRRQHTKRDSLCRATWKRTNNASSTTILQSNQRPCVY